MVSTIIDFYYIEELESKRFKINSDKTEIWNVILVMPKVNTFVI